MKRFILPLLLLTTSQSATAAGLPGWVNAEAAQLYAKAALIEWSSVSYKRLDRGRLDLPPLILARVGNDGTKIVRVVYGTADGSYDVTMVVERDGFLHVIERGATIESPEELAAWFHSPEFDPSYLMGED